MLGPGRGASGADRPPVTSQPTGYIRLDFSVQDASAVCTAAGLPRSGLAYLVHYRTGLPYRAAWSGRTGGCTGMARRHWRVTSVTPCCRAMNDSARPGAA
jgi:hypothetical protein